MQLYSAISIFTGEAINTVSKAFIELYVIHPFLFSYGVLKQLLHILVVNKLEFLTGV